MTDKSKLYELIQSSKNSNYPIQVDVPKFSYDDDFDQETNTHYMTCKTVMTIDDIKTNFTSDIYSNRKGANQDVCSKIYQYILNLANDESNRNKNTNNANNTDTSDIPTEILIDRNLLILIDYENVSVNKHILQLDDFLSRVCMVQIDESIDESILTDSSSESILTYSDENCQIKPIEVIKFAGKSSSMKGTADVVVNSTRKDAVDHYIGYYLGQRIGETPSIVDTHSIHILSRDHFASCLEDFNEAVIHNVDVDDLINSILTFKVT
jgi:hypothetical protein